MFAVKSKPKGKDVSERPFQGGKLQGEHRDSGQGCNPFSRNTLGVSSGWKKLLFVPRKKGSPQTRYRNQGLGGFGSCAQDGEVFSPTRKRAVVAQGQIEGFCSMQDRNLKTNVIGFIFCVCACSCFRARTMWIPGRAWRRGRQAILFPHPGRGDVQRDNVKPSRGRPRMR